MATGTKEKSADAGTDEQGFPVNSSDAAPPTDDTDTTKAKGGARPRPTYAAVKVTELPQDLTLPRSGPRTDPALVEALQIAQDDAGEWYCVATYQSANGAKTALKRIKDGKITVPSGEWDFEARRVEAPESTAQVPVRWSKLYARSLG